MDARKAVIEGDAIIPPAWPSREESEQMTAWLYALDKLMTEKSYITIAIDGPSGAGKSSLAAWLQNKQEDCAVFHMDDFFLPVAQKTRERLQTPGGNVDWERFLCEVLTPIRRGEPFSYRPFNCSTGELEAAVFAAPGKLSIVEGVYSHHPALRDAYDMTVFLSIDRDLQLERIRKRNGGGMLERFINEWIPLEDLYFKKMEIIQKADYVISV